MSEIYSHEDRDGDGFYLRSRGDELKFRAYGTDHSILTREDVTRLRNSLTEWLGENDAPQLTEADVRRIVQEEWVTRTPAPIVLGVSDDPEPREVGHAGDPWGVACTRCMHKSGVHVGNGGCHAVLPGGVYCECTLDEAGASAPRASAPECNVDHRTHLHSRGADFQCACTCGRCTP